MKRGFQGNSLVKKTKCPLMRKSLQHHQIYISLLLYPVVNMFHMSENSKRSVFAQLALLFAIKEIAYHFLTTLDRVHFLVVSFTIGNKRIDGFGNGNGNISVTQ
jgi:hypothetical protein